MKTHQKCFSLREPRSKKLADKLPARLQPQGQGRRQGDRRRQREGDRGAALGRQVLLGAGPQEEARADALRARRASPSTRSSAPRWNRMERITELARQIAGAVDAEPEHAGRAAQLCKADLVSGMVGEFPELQGLMGRYYAEAEKMHPKIARAIEEHYKPRGPTDTVPTGGRRSRSRSRSPTSSTRWSASGPSARSRRARAIPISSAAPRSASSASFWRTTCGCRCPRYIAEVYLLHCGRENREAAAELRGEVEGIMQAARRNQGCRLRALRAAASGCSERAALHAVCADRRATSWPSSPSA